MGVDEQNKTWQTLPEHSTVGLLNENELTTNVAELPKGSLRVGLQGKIAAGK